MPTLSIRREAGISFAINAALSLAFFLAVFGFVARPLSWRAPDALALDFMPQSIAVALMSALVPVLIARKRLGGALAPVRGIVLRALGFAIGGALLGGLLAWVTHGALSPIGWLAALTIKLFYGGSLGATITTLALRRMS